MPFDLDPDYKQVPERIADFKAKHPDGTLQSRFLGVEQIGDVYFVVVEASAYRTPDDPRPGMGLAWERVPGLTPYTKNSELQNGETSAWGRAIVAALASESKAVASAEDVRNRAAEQGTPAASSRRSTGRGRSSGGTGATAPSSLDEPPSGGPDLEPAVHRKLMSMLRGLDIDTFDHDKRVAFLSAQLGYEVTSSKNLSLEEVEMVIDRIRQGARPA